MAWDAVAENMAVNVIAKVEGAGAWDAINYHDPITIGVMQWFGTRAADLLNDIEAGNPAQYALIAQSLRDDLTAHADTSDYWPARYLTTEEGDSLKPVLRAVKDIQSAQILADITEYKKVIIRYKVNVDTHTNMAIFWCCMYHQSPRQAIRVLNRVGPKATLDEIYAACYNDAIFSGYRSRYTQARDIIASGVAPNIVDLNDEGIAPGDGDSNGDGGIGDNIGPSPTEPQRTNADMLQVFGDAIHFISGGAVSDRAFASGGPFYTLAGKFSGTTVNPAPVDPEDVPDPDPNPDPPTGDEVTDKQNALKKFMVDRIGTLKYSQGPERYPISSGYCDCSSLVRSAYEAVLGINPGGYTDAQVTSNTTRLIEKGGGGNSPNEANMKVGDLVISARYGTAANRIASHVEMYIGGGQIIGHGGIPYMGPVIKNLHDRTVDKKTWWVKRANNM